MACGNKPEEKNICRTTVGKPVNPILGIKMLTESPDLFVDAPLALYFSRTYALDVAHQGPLGQGWSLDFGYRIKIKEAHIILYDPYGKRDYFPHLSVGTQHLISKGQIELSHPSKMLYVVSKQGRFYHFESNTTSQGYHRLTSIKDNNNNALSFHYEAAKTFPSYVSIDNHKLFRILGNEYRMLGIEESLYAEAKGIRGRPVYDKLMMFKILILQKYYKLSDEQIEFQINDRTSFKQFLGLKFGDKIPDQKTIWHFKEQLMHKNVSQKLFALFTTQLMSKGIIAKEGSMIDAIFVAVPRQRNTREDNADIKKGAVPLTFAKKDKYGKHSKLLQKDIDVRWISKNAERHYGYTDHINTDVKTKLIIKYNVSAASAHDATEIENIIDETDKKLYADSVYRSKEIEAFLEKQNCESFVHEKGYRGKLLTEKQKESNNKKSKTRAKVEYIFGFMTNSMHDALPMRSIGIKCVKSSIGFLNLTYNFFRYEQLVRLQKVKVM